MINYALASSTWDQEELDVSSAVMQSGQLTMGAEVSAFEKEFAQYIGTKYAVMFNSGSSANLGILTALRYFRGTKAKEGDRVIVPTVSWSTTYYPVNQAGFVLDFVDINSETLNIDVEKVIAAIKLDTTAIFAVNLLGNPADLNRLRKIADDHGIYLIEDNCESLGADIDGKKTGSFGLAGSHSFYFSHHICTMEGGMVTTDSKEFMEALISIRAHGWTRGLDKENSVHNKSDNEWEDLFRFVLPGYNLRPIELSGALGRVQLKKFDKFLQARRQNATHFVKTFRGIPEVKIQVETGASSWFGFSLILQGKLSEKREALIEVFEAAGIQTRPIVAGDFTTNPVMKHLKVGDLPSTDAAKEIDRSGFFIGNHHYDVTHKIDQIREVLTKFIEEC